MNLLILKYVLNIEMISYLWLFATYGYSFTVFLLTTALNIVPLEWLRWTLLSVSALISICVILHELWRTMKEQLGGANLTKFLLIVGFLVASHGVLILSLKHYFLA
jgi:hypothetical protein